MILVDTTVWIDFFTDKETRGTRKLTRAIEEEEDLATCGLVMTDVLQGVRNDRQFARIKQILQDLVYLPFTREIFVGAAEIYRLCRRKGLTIRKSVDCIIAATCIDHSSFILHNDRDFNSVAKHFPLQSY